MVQITQTEEEIKIIIELNRLITRKPDIIVLPKYLKFNNPPIFFERHLMHEIDDVASFCRIFKNEARIVLIKKEKGLWPEIFQTLSKEELFKKRLEISDQIVLRNKERDEKALERYDAKRRTEIEREVRRETAMREKVKQFNEQACHEAMTVAPKETHVKPKHLEGARAMSAPVAANVVGRVATPIAPRTMAAVRSSAKINFNFSTFQYSTPKRESQEGLPRPFTEEYLPKPMNKAESSSS